MLSIACILAQWHEASLLCNKKKKSPAAPCGYCLAFTRACCSFHHCPCWKWDHCWHTDVWFNGSWICAGPVGRKGRKGIPWTLQQVLGVDQRCVLALCCYSLTSCYQSGWFFCWLVFLLLLFSFERYAVWANFHVQRWKLWCGPVVLYTISSAAILSSVAGARQMSHVVFVKQFVPLPIFLQTDHTWCFIQNSDCGAPTSNLLSVVSSSAVLGVAELFRPGRTTPFCNACLPLSGTNPRGVGSGLAFCECSAMVGSKPRSATRSRGTGRHCAGFWAEVFLQILLSRYWLVGTVNEYSQEQRG